MTTKTKIGFQEESTCRICLESEGKKISPCKCIGSVEWVHE
jgi:E3 ubiquitin-protein ligase DOA10